MEFCNSSRVHEPCVGNICRNTYKNDCEIAFEKNDCESWAIVWHIHYGPWSSSKMTFKEFKVSESVYTKYSSLKIQYLSVKFTNSDILRYYFPTIPL